MLFLWLMGIEPCLICQKTRGYIKSSTLFMIAVECHGPAVLLHTIRPNGSSIVNGLKGGCTGILHKMLLFNLRELEHAKRVREKTMELLPVVPGAKNVTFRQAFGDEDTPYQYLITIDFDSMEEHEQYLVHESHVEFSKQHFRPYVSDLLIQFFE